MTLKAILKYSNPVLRLTIAFKGELDNWPSRCQSLTLAPLDAGC
jgi:hypothetical protein